MTTIFHIDVNSAFLSWTAASRPVDEAHPDLRTIPSIIGGDEKIRHGIVLAKSVPAKAYGIRTAQTVQSALRLCPQLVIAAPDHALYRKKSAELMSLLSSYTSDLEQLSIDECFMDFGPIAHLYTSPWEAASKIASQVRTQLGFTVNIGISTNRVLAKMASDFEKPDRIHTLYPEEIADKLWPLPVEALYMVGRSASARLHSLGLHTIGSLASADPAFLTAHFHSHGRLMWEYANGIDSDVIDAARPKRKGIGSSTTLARDVDRREDALRVLLRLADEVSSRMRKADAVAKSASVEIRYGDFVNTSRQMLCDPPLSSSQQLMETAVQLFDQLWDGRPIRLLGLRVTKLLDRHSPVQLSLFDLPQPDRPDERTEQDQHAEKQRRMDLAADAIRRRFGENALIRGTFLKPPEPS